MVERGRSRVSLHALYPLTSIRSDQSVRKLFTGFEVAVRIV